jgi:hypothetical protein
MSHLGTPEMEEEIGQVRLLEEPQSFKFSEDVFAAQTILETLLKKLCFFRIM